MMLEGVILKRGLSQTASLLSPEGVMIRPWPGAPHRRTKVPDLAFVLPVIACYSSLSMCPGGKGVREGNAQSHLSSTLVYSLRPLNATYT